METVRRLSSVAEGVGIEEGKSVAYVRFVRAALSLYGEDREFEIAIPEGYDEVKMAATFRAHGCDTTYLTQKRTIFVVCHDPSLL